MISHSYRNLHFPTTEYNNPRRSNHTTHYRIRVRYTLRTYRTSIPPWIIRARTHFPHATPFLTSLRNRNGNCRGFRQSRGMPFLRRWTFQPCSFEIPTHVCRRRHTDRTKRPCHSLSVVMVRKHLPTHHHRSPSHRVDRTLCVSTLGDVLQLRPYPCEYRWCYRHVSPFRSLRRVTHGQCADHLHTAQYTWPRPVTR